LPDWVIVNWQLSSPQKAVDLQSMPVRKYIGGLIQSRPQAAIQTSIEKIDLWKQTKIKLRRTEE